MARRSLEEIHHTVTTACRAVEVFGPLAGPLGMQLAALAGVFRALVQVAHPDHCPGEQTMAERTLQRLRVWRQRAREEIRSGAYGATAAPVTVGLRTGSYAVHEALRTGDYATVYRCTTARMADRAALELKVARGMGENQWVRREAQVLRQLGRMPTEGRRYLPRLVEAFVWRDGADVRQALLAEVRRGLHSLAEVRAAFPGGLDPRDAAWMFNRMLEALWFAHGQGWVHGAVLPANLHVSPEDHGLILDAWGLAVEAGRAPAALSAAYGAWYPAEARRGAAATPGTDVALAVRCLVYLLGGDPVRGALPAGVPGAMQRFVRGCLPGAAARGPQDAGALREEFDELLGVLYGRRAFRPLVIPA